MPVRASVPVESANLDAMRTSYWDFSKIHKAIRTGTVIVITYRSMQNPEPHKRTVRPHSLIQAGPRWHIRAYCDEAHEFRDFNIGRIGSVEIASDADLPGPEFDSDWNTKVELRLVPHSSLTLPQMRLVQEEFLSNTSALVVHVRKPMARYVVQAYRAATNPATESPPAYLLMVHMANELPDGTLWD
jgi:predicted DNA-binding transcriptional regulator YafY